MMSGIIWSEMNGMQDLVWNELCASFSILDEHAFQLFMV